MTEVLAQVPWLGGLFSFVFGTIVGSFLNVCIYRIPEGKSIVHPGSRCACGAPIPWFDNLPVLSWLLLRGRARCCGRRFSVRYPAIEALTGALFLAAWLRFGLPVAPAAFLFLALLVVIVFIDLDHLYIPDRFSIGGMLLVLVVVWFLPEIHGFPGTPAGALGAVATGVVGALVGSAVVFWTGAVAEVVLRKEAMGLGDVKLAGLFGAFLGWQGAVFSLFGGAVLGTVVLLPVLLLKGRKGEEGSAPAGGGDEADPEAPSLGFGSQVPFGPMLCAGAALYLLWLGPSVDAYLAELWTTLEWLVAQ